MSTMTITRDGSDYEVELEGMCLQPADPSVGIMCDSYEEVLATNDELGQVKLTDSEEEEALAIVNDELWSMSTIWDTFRGRRMPSQMLHFRGV